MNKTNYSVKAIKSFRSRNGYGYSCNLLRDGKKVAEILEEGRGGEMRIDWMDFKSTATFISRNHEDKEVSCRGTVEEALFNEQVRSLPKIAAHDGFPEMDTSLGIVIDDMVNDTLAIKKLSASMKKSVTVKRGDGKFLTWKITPVHSAPAIRTYILKNYPDGKIMNDLPVEEVLQLYKQAELVS